MGWIDKTIDRLVEENLSQYTGSNTYDCTEKILHQFRGEFRQGFLKRMILSGIVTFGLFAGAGAAGSYGAAEIKNALLAAGAVPFLYGVYIWLDLTTLNLHNLVDSVEGRVQKYLTERLTNPGAH